MANLRPDHRDRLVLVGRERAIIYKTLVLSGLRKNELATLTVSQLILDHATPHIELDAPDEKNREGNSVAIRADLAADLRSWLDDKLSRARVESARKGEPPPERLPGDIPVFTVPGGIVRIFDRDLRLAGIPKRDSRGRTLDVHALRTTFGTLLSKRGVPLRTAQAALRHSHPGLTANIYTDPKLLDVSGALDALPGLSLGRSDAGETGGSPEGGIAQLAPQLAPDADPEGHPLSAGGNRAPPEAGLAEGPEIAEVPGNVGLRPSLSSPGNHCRESGQTDQITKPSAGLAGGFVSSRRSSTAGMAVGFGLLSAS